MSVNVSVSDLMNEHLPDRIAGLLREHSLPPGSFVMEITEMTIIEEFERSEQVVTQLRTRSSC